MARIPQRQRLRALPVQLIEMDGGVILKRGCTEVKIEGEGAAEVVQAILCAAVRQGASREEICDLFAAPDRPLVDRLIEQLLVRRLLVAGDASQSVADGNESSLDVFYWHFGATVTQVTQKLSSLRIVVLGVNCISRQLARSLQASNVPNFQVVDYPLLRNAGLFDDAGRLKDEEWPLAIKAPQSFEEWANTTALESMGCLVATSDFGAQSVMREWNRFCVEHQLHFLPVVLHNFTGYVGPLVIPCETACYECLRARQSSHVADHDAWRAAEAVAVEGQSVTGFHPAMASVLGDIAAIELTKFYGEVLPLRKIGTLIEVNLLATKLSSRKVLKVPRCPVCSSLNSRSSATAERRSFAPATSSDT